MQVLNNIARERFKAEGDISSVFSSLSGETLVSLPEEFSELKKKIVRNPEVLRESWLRLKVSLSQEIDSIKQLGSRAIPSVDFQDLEKLSSEDRQEILKRGCVVVRNVVDRKKAESLKQDVKQYIAENPSTRAFPKDNPVVYELYWSKSQLAGRADPRMNQVMTFINSLWHADDESLVSFHHNLHYADRLRIRPPGDAMFSLGPHADGGSLERWEDPEYRSCFNSIWAGDWENYDAYDATHRLEAKQDLHESIGQCSVFRTFQGWLSLSEVGPNEGTIKLAPLVKHITAYYLLRPFFDDDDNLDLDSTVFQGAFPGKAQEFFEKDHYDLRLSELMTPVPKVYPGDAVFWHCDLIHAVDPIHMGTKDSSVMYIPAVPLCRTNSEYIRIQRDAFLKGYPAPDFPGYPTAAGESKHIGRVGKSFIHYVGGDPAVQAMGLEPISVNSSDSKTRQVVQDFNKILGFE